MKVIRSCSKSRQQKKCVFPQCKTSVCNNSGSVEDKAVQFACMGFSYMLDQVVRCHLCHLTESTHICRWSALDWRVILLYLCPLFIELALKMFFSGTWQSMFVGGGVVMRYPFFHTIIGIDAQRSMLFTVMNFLKINSLLCS